MTEFLIYDAKVAALIVVFYMFYRLLLARETFHRVNRIVLLLTAVASFVLPLCVITFHKTVTIAQPAITVGDLQMTVAEDTATPWWQIVLPILFILGMVATLGHTLWSLFRIVRLIRNSEQHPQPDGTTICVTGNAALSPFSWMHYIVMNRQDFVTKDAAILAHERGHIRLRHSWDLLLVDTLTALQWFNPAMWMLRSDLRALHEFEADAAVLSEGINARQYQYLLISKAAGIGGYSLANGISHSTLKNRINMMLHKKSQRSHLLKLLALVPVFGAALALNAETVTDIVYDEPQKKIVKKGKQDAKVKVSPVEEIVVVAYGDEPTFQMHGIVRDQENGDPVVGAVIKIANSKKGTVTDANGAFTLDVKKGDTVEALYVGYASNAIVIKEPQSNYEFILQKDNSDKTDDAFDVVEEMPQYPGGAAAMMQYLSMNVRYPKEAYANGVQGRVIATFVVEKDGSISDAKVVKSVSPELDAEALRVINTMPKWTPGKQNGKVVRVKYAIPISFKLQGSAPKNTATGSFTPNDDAATNGPFFVVDGKPMAADKVKDIDPKTIDHMDVLKDASAVKLYGEKARNGAIVITTKK